MPGGNERDVVAQVYKQIEVDFPMELICAQHQLFSPQKDTHCYLCTESENRALQIEVGALGSSIVALRLASTNDQKRIATLKLLHEEAERAFKSQYAELERANAMIKVLKRTVRDVVAIYSEEEE